MHEVFRVGGFGMWPTLFFGLLLLGVAGWYAARPERRFMPLLVSAGLMTLLSGLLGFSMGLVNSLLHLGKVNPDDRYIWLIGLGESLYNVVFALVFLMLAAIAASVGAWRLARSPAGRSTFGHGVA
ncbi:MAG: hypothetical protein IT371_20485 [Deltaproteobacteria bacterium]|nr:hypothetical protein [Deltaproteobacteria bacterium]